MLELRGVTLGPREGGEWAPGAAETLASSISNVTNLVKLSVEDCFFRDENLRTLLSPLTMLRCLSLTGSFGDDRPGSYLTDKGFRTIASVCPNLQTLDVSYFGLTTTRGLEAILQSCQNLRELHAPYTHIDDREYARLFRPSNSVLLFRFGSLRVDVPRRSIREAVIASEGRTVMVGPHGLIEFSDLADEHQAVAARGKEIAERASEKARQSGVFNEWEDLFE